MVAERNRLTIRVLYVLGTRPEFIRSVRILHHLIERDNVELVLVHTGQHYDHNMSAGFFELLPLPQPRHFLGCGGRSRTEQVTCVTAGTATIIEQYLPTCVCIFGDTNTSLGGCLAAVTKDVPVVHIEAGARSHDMTMPEEVNRRLIDHGSDLLLAVSQACVENLTREDVPGHVVDVGDPLYDVFADNIALLPISSLDPRAKPKCLMTLHRQGLLDDRKALSTVLRSVSRFAEAEEIEVVFPAHPRTATIIRRELAESVSGISVTAPLLYQDLLCLLRDSVLVITDSGGLQKEAFWAGKPCVTVRSTTEWGETVAAGANVLALGEEVGAAAEHMLSVKFSPPTKLEDPYHGKGASARVVDALVERYGRP